MAAAASPTDPRTSEPERRDPIAAITELLDDDPSVADAEPTIRDDKGRFSSPTAAAPTAPEPDPEGEPEPDPAAASPEGEPTEPEGEPAEGAEPAEGEPAPEGEGDPDAVYSFGDLAQTLEMEEGELADHLHVEGPNGEAVPLSEVVRSYREQPERAAALAELQGEREQLTAQRTELTNAKDTELNRMAAVTQAVLRMVNPQADQAELARLREEDPQAYLIRKNELQERDQAVARALREMQGEADRRDHEAKEGRAQMVKDEVRRLQAAKPEWRDPAKAQPAMAQVGNYLKSKGFTQEEVDGLVDHRMVLVAWDALQLQNLTDKRPTLRKKLADLKGRKRVLPAQARRAEESQAAKRARTAKGRLRNTGRVEDAGSVIEGLL